MKTFQNLSGEDRMTDKILLRYSTEKADKPIISSIIRETNTPINILHADLTPEGGEIFISIDAPEEKVEKVVNLFKERGVDTEKITEGVELDEKKCIDCGACVSLCPTEALGLSDDDSLFLDKEECVYCRVCVPACPVDALSVRKL